MCVFSFYYQSSARPPPPLLLCLTIVAVFQCDNTLFLFVNMCARVWRTIIFLIRLCFVLFLPEDFSNACFAVHETDQETKKGRERERTFREPTNSFVVRRAIGWMTVFSIAPTEYLHMFSSRQCLLCSPNSCVDFLLLLLLLTEWSTGERVLWWLGSFSLSLSLGDQLDREILSERSSLYGQVEHQ